jgi:stage II sporulation protein D
VRAADDGTLTATVTISFRQYLEGIAEVPPSWPRAALEAQVVAARSYVLARTGWSGQQGESLDTPICGTADCQVFGGRPADTVYFSTSNGRTYGNDEVFGSSPLPYLRPVTERHDGASPLSRWQVELPLDDLTTMLRAAGEWPGGTAIASATVQGSTVRLKSGGRTGTIDTGALRDAVNTWAPCLLPRRYPSDGLPVTIPSGWLDVAASPRSLVVTGRGWGHGVGMVQWGAYGKARRGWTASQILAFYYGGLTPKRFPEPGTMQVVVATGLRSMIVKPTEAGAAIGGRILGRRPIRIEGGEAVTVSSSSG